MTLGGHREVRRERARPNLPTSCQAPHTYLLDVSHQMEEVWVVPRGFLEQKSRTPIRKENSAPSVSQRVITVL